MSLEVVSGFTGPTHQQPKDIVSVVLNKIVGALEGLPGFGRRAQLPFEGRYPRCTAAFQGQLH